MVLGCRPIWFASSICVSPRPRRRAPMSAPVARRTSPDGGRFLGIRGIIAEAMGRPKLLKNMTPEEKRARRRKMKAANERARRKREAAKRRASKAHKNKLNARRCRRWRAGLGVLKSREKRLRDGARCYDWAALLPFIDKRPDGHWLWTGALRRVFGRVRPIARAGFAGKEHVDFIVCCLAHGRPPTINCFVRRTCSEVLCVSPACLTWTTRVMERARRKQRGEDHVQEELARGK